MDEQTIMIGLRLVHILAGIFWVGSVFLIASFLVPAMRATGPDGGRFMQHLMQQRRLPVFLGLAMLLTIVSGLTMYARFTSTTHGTWARTAPGITYGVGALAAILAAVVGGAIGGTAGRRLMAIGARAGAAGPSPDQLAEIQRLQARVGTANRVTAALLAVAAAAMAAGRYL